MDQSHIDSPIGASMIAAHKGCDVCGGAGAGLIPINALLAKLSRVGDNRSAGWFSFVELRNLFSFLARSRVEQAKDTRSEYFEPVTRGTMNILMFTNTFMPHIGGVRRSIDVLSAGLRKHGHQVLTVAPRNVWQEK